MKDQKMEEQTAMRELSDQELENVSGGYIIDNGEDYEPKNERYFILDDKGNIVKRYGGKSRTLLYARDHGYNRRFLTAEEWKRLVETGSPD